MSTDSYLCDASRTRTFLSDTHGIHALALFSEKGGTPRLRSFMHHAWTSRPKDLADEVAKLKPEDPTVARLCRTLAKHARAADEILMLTLEPLEIEKTKTARKRAATRTRKSKSIRRPSATGKVKRSHRSRRTRG